MSKSSDDLPEWPQDLSGSPAFNLGPAMEPRELPEFRHTPTAEPAGRRIGQDDKQLEILAALQRLSEAQASEAAMNARRQAEQQKFNRRISWVALALAMAIIVVPLVLAMIEALIELFSSG